MLFTFSASHKYLLITRRINPLKGRIERIMIIKLSCLLLFISISVINAQYSGGDGTRQNPYKISTPDDLALIVKDAYSSKYFVQTSDIDLTQYLDTCTSTAQMGWLPIGINGSPFKGFYDGANHKIKGLWIERPSMEGTGLFGYTSDATIINVSIEIPEGKAITGGKSVAAVCGFAAFGQIINCKVTGTIRGESNVGGIAGSNWGTIQNCSVNATINASAGDCGGISGRAANNSWIVFCQTNSTVTGVDRVGGVLGNSNMGVTMVFNTFSSGTVSGKTFVGGILGYGDRTTRLCNSYTLSKITGDSACGGVAGVNEGSISNSYFLKDTDINVQLSGIGEDKKDQLRNTYAVNSSGFKSKATFPWWDFDFVWKIDPSVNNGYPFTSLKPADEIYSGQGTESSPFIITTPEQLQALNYFGADSSLFFRLRLDIDLSIYLSSSGTGYNNGCGWLPVERLNGNLNGAGHYIKGLWIERPYEVYSGLINLCSGKINGLGVEGDEKKWITGLNYAGILCSRTFSSSVVSDCYTKGRVRATDLSGGFNGMERLVGGLIGDNSGKMQNCYSLADCHSEQKDSVTKTNSDGVGGLVGKNDLGSIIDCYAKGKITCKSSNSGGLAGFNQGIVTNCYASGEVVAEGRASSAGGLIGMNTTIAEPGNGFITLSYATGSVSANGTLAEAGGLVGTMMARYGGTIRDAFCTGNVSVSGESAVAGGFVGYCSGVIENCYSVGSVSLTGSSPSVGGFAGKNTNSFLSCYYLKSDQINAGFAAIGADNNTEAPQLGNISGKTDGELKIKETFNGWNFDSVWTIKENVSCPALKNGLIVVVKPSVRESDQKQRTFLRIGNGTLLYSISEREQNSELILFNSKGQMVRKYSNLQGSGALRVQGMVSGLYFAQTKSRQGSGRFYRVSFLE